MKLYATVHSERMSQPAKKGGNELLRMEINYKNHLLGQLEIRANSDGVVCFEWFDRGGYSLKPSDRRILSIETQGERQKGERTPENIAKWLVNGEHDKLQEKDYIKG